jgi:hypothetical protein
LRVRANKVVVDGMVFQSDTEGRRYVYLRDLQRKGEISKLQCHPTFRFIVQGIPIAKYSPDFVYHDGAGKIVVEDAKGFKRSKKTGAMLPRVNREFGMKKKLMKACFGLEVRIV